ncbi:MAG: bifunctional diaminohydroxyphosphoribosylaminopyrimidine deaminase/5-amino-6-(5-phosphoribosylamino)uracil reductase RibD [Flammeovirgaceae bacterium]|nr:bifunctional diaminohydroxyphosphoribosylaminopyrimidine deaminase/5-amino-6-(5-phosphoribosylamino)uracil reductase RibD [Flammeovirgaceae bacterium]
MTVISDEFFMMRAMELAQRGAGYVSPNPMVGCVITHENKIVGEGFHAVYGQAHAEVMAIRSVADSSILSESVLYVSLEPCSHVGRTPPCADLIVASKIKKVFVSILDRNPLVSGRGIQRLKNSGVEVEVGLCERQAVELNRRFFTAIDEKRPYVILKWAQTADGFIARENGESKWISNAHSRQLVHKWRGEEDAILVGTTTARVDNPALTVRNWNGKNPLRIVIDNDLKLSKDLKLFDGLSPTICYTLKDQNSKENLEYVKIAKEKFLKKILNDLHQRKIQSVIIEGGAHTLHSFLKEGLWDEARIFHSTQKFGIGIEAPRISGSPFSKEDVMDDRLEIYRAR